METVPEKLYVLQDGERTGPFPRQRVLQMLEVGSISPSTFVWAKGMADWAALETIMDELAAAPEQSMPVRPQAVDSSSQATAAFGGVIAGAFAFPFRGFGWATILTGSIVLTGIEWFGMLPAAPGILMLFLGVTAWGYILLIVTGDYPADRDG